MKIDVCPVCGDFDIGDWCNHCNIPTKETSSNEPSYEPNIYDMGYREEIASQGHWIELPDGYNGNIERFFIIPIEENNIEVKLRCATKGKEYMIKYAYKSEYKKAMIKAGFLQGE